MAKSNEIGAAMSGYDPKYCIYGKVDAVIDGDTLYFIVEEMGSEVEKLQDELRKEKQETDPILVEIANSEEVSSDDESNAAHIINTGDTLKIRVAGINTPEVDKPSNNYDAKNEKTNKEYVSRFDISPEKSVQVANEARDVLRKKCNDAHLVFLEMDLDAEGKIKVDKYGRYIAMVHVIENREDAQKARSGKIVPTINMSRYLTTTAATSISANGHVPLAILYTYYILLDYSRFDWMKLITLWDLKNTDSDIKLGAIFEDNDGETFEAYMDDVSAIDIRYSDESYDNRIEFVEPKDDRLEDLFPNGEVTDRVRIGDVFLAVPPLAIQMSQANTIERTKTLRSKSSMITKTGSTNRSITLQLYFHDLDAINGYKWETEGGMTYYMDGLRPLIAQFKKAPFLPIDNEYINNVLNIHSVGLANLSVTTVPGFPHSISATLTLMEFEHSAYMPHLEYLQGAINYPLLRWYYQDLMVPKDSPTRTYLPPIEGDLTNELSFSIASEDDLQARKSAIEDLRQLDPPQQEEAKLKDNNTEYGRVWNDGWMAQEVLRQWKRYEQLRTENPWEFAPPPENDEDFHGVQRGINLGKAYVLAPDIGIGEAKRPEDNRMEEFWADIYNVSQKDIDAAKASGQMYAWRTAVLELAGRFIPYESWELSAFYNLGQYDPLNERYLPMHAVNLYGDSYVEELTRYSKVFWSTRYDGGLLFTVESETARGEFDEEFIISETDNLTTFYLPATTSNKRKLEKILSRAWEIEKEIQGNIDAYNKRLERVEGAEQALELEPYEIHGDMIVNSIEVMYQNEFSGAQLQQHETPTLQYIGSQDPYIQLSMDVSEEAVYSLKNMISLSNEYARNFRVGISSGFLGIDNQLTRLFGIKHIMVETMNVNTVPGYPGRFHVQMTMVGFDKTQRRQEDLDGISAVDDNVTKAERQMLKDPTASDQAVLEIRMRDMEVYPDLELPTYEELNKVLPKLDSGIDGEYPNRSHAKFVDPDFYMSSTWSIREQVRNMRMMNQTMEMSDMAGVTVTTGSKIDAPFTAGKEDLDILRGMEKEVEEIKGGFKWDDLSFQNAMSEATFSTDFVNSDRREDSITEIENWIETPGAKVKLLASDWRRWYGEGLGRFDNPQPEDYEVYEKIYELIDKYWEGEFFDDTKEGVRSKAWEEVTYEASDDDLYRRMSLVANQDNPSASLDRLSLSSSLDFTSLGQFNNKITRERLANIIKSIFHVTSRWRQLHHESRISINKEDSAVGIGKIPIRTHALSIDMAKRLMWDWEFNLEYSMAYLRYQYERAKKSSDPDKQARPWDWMIRGYEQGDFSRYNGEANEELKTPFYHKVYSVFDKFYAKPHLTYASPVGPFRIKILELENMDGEINDFALDLLKVNRDAIIEVAAQLGYENGFGSNTEGDKQDARDELKQLNNSELMKTIVDFLDNFFGIKSYSETTEGDNIPDFSDSNLLGDTSSSDTLKGGRREKYAEYHEGYLQYLKLKVNIDNLGKMMNSQTPQELFEGIFTDIISHDHRGRLLRAFPTFQMFIVDEGKWMAQYRLWDNLYGYNAIQSIDVHKSRKIAADTAIITMTNVYGNLTTKSMDTSYGEWDYSFWDNLVMGRPSQDLLDARKELLSSMMLKTGARIHLRMGYGASVSHLPIVFNGTITEMDTQDVVTIIAQGDGVELGNIISADPGEDNDQFFGGVTEPRDLICKFLTSKGNWFKDALSYNKIAFNNTENPLGIQHFGRPGSNASPPGNVFWLNEDYGEAAQNIYSTNGLETFSQTKNLDGTDITLDQVKDTHMFSFLQAGDEANIIVPFYNNTVWDIAQTIAYASRDYVAAVVPFEMRSTLFFGKPHWRMAYRYDSTYKYLPDQKQWIRYLNMEHRKPFMQAHMFNGATDIISNKIKASEEGVYTNVICTFDGNQTPVAYADRDIRFDKQKTIVIDAPIIDHNVFSFWRSEVQGINFAISAVRDYMKDMYKGQLLVMGDPTLKPHDICYMDDRISSMNGNFMVKSVTHQFSHATGFVSSVEPDCVSVADDLELLHINSWTNSFFASLGANTFGTYFAVRGYRALINSSIAQSLLAKNGKHASKINSKALKNITKGLPEKDKAVKELKRAANEYAAIDDKLATMRDPESSDNPKARERLRKKQEEYQAERQKALDKLEQKQGDLEKRFAEWDKEGKFSPEEDTKMSRAQAAIKKKNTQRRIQATRKAVEAAKDGKNAHRLIRAASLLANTTFWGIAISVATQIGLTILTETLLEKYRRHKALSQVALIAPLQYHGRNFTAGINGYKGFVVGSDPGRMDKFLSGTADMEEGQDPDIVDAIVDVLNWASGAERDFSVTEEDIRDNDHTNYLGW